MFGCSIGIFFIFILGFVGFLVELNNLMCEFKSGFFILLYVVIVNFYELYID